MSAADSSQIPKCPSCGFTVFNRRYPKCENCGAALPAALVLSSAERARLQEKEEKDAIEEELRELERRKQRALSESEWVKKRATPDGGW